MNKRRREKLCALALALTLLLPPAARAADIRGECGQDITWTLDSAGTLTLDGSGETHTYNRTDGYAPWYQVRDQIRSVRVQGKITALNGVLFNGCNNLTDITLCASLERLTIADRDDRWPDSLVSVTVEKDSGDSADGENEENKENDADADSGSADAGNADGGSTGSGNTGEKKTGNFLSHESVLYAKAAAGGEYATSDGTDGTAGKYTLLFYPPSKPDAEYDTPEDTRAVADGAFYRSAYLERLTLNDGLRRIPKFYHCTGLKEISIPDSVRELPASAFEGCTALEEARLPDGVREIPSFAFYGCSALKTLEIPATVTTVHTSAFWLCDALNPITLPASVQTVKGTGKLPVTSSPDLSRYKEWVFQGDVPDFQNWTGGVMAGPDGGLCAVGDRVRYPAGAAGWDAYVRSFRTYSGEQVERTIFEEYGQQPLRRSKTWLNGDGTILDTVSWIDGERIPPDTTKIPVKAPVNGTAYQFDHWEEDTTTEADTVYTPVFTAEQEDPYQGQFRVIYRASVNGERREDHYAGGTEIALRENLFPAPEGKMFRCWAIWGTEYQPGDKYLVTEDVYVTAQWDDAPEPEPGTGTAPGTNPGSSPATAPSSGQQNCYVATAVYGSYDCPEVWTLRRYRDEVLAQSWYGRLFIRGYYAVSPAAVRLLGGTGWFQTFFRARLDRMTERLQAEGVSSAPYQDLNW